MNDLVGALYPSEGPIVRCPTVRMPVPTTTSDPALFLLLPMPYPTGGNTAVVARRIAADIPRTGAVGAPRIAADIPRAAAVGGPRNADTPRTVGAAPRTAAGISPAEAGAPCCTTFLCQMPGPAAFPRAVRRLSPQHRFLEPSCLFPKASQRPSRRRAGAGIHRASVDQWQDLTRTLSDWWPVRCSHGIESRRWP